MSIDVKIAHLGFIQGVINRMGNNSFLVKGWTVTLVAAIFALAPKDAKSAFVYVSLIPIAVFWMLDSYYLREEQLFRKLYEGVAAETIKSEHFTMKTSAFTHEVSPLWKNALTQTVFPFYSLIIVLLVLVAIATKANIHWRFICN